MIANKGPATVIDVPITKGCYHRDEHGQRRCNGQKRDPPPALAAETKGLQRLRIATVTA